MLFPSKIILFIAIDLINVLAFKGKPFIIINETAVCQREDFSG